MLRRPRFNPLLKSAINGLLLAGICFLNQTELLAQKAPLPAPVLEGCSCQRCKKVVIPPAVADVLKTIVCKHFDIVVNSGGKYSTEQRLNALNVISVAASKKEYQDKKQWQNIISRLEIMLYVSEEDHALQCEIVKQLPLFMHYKIISSAEAGASNGGAAAVAVPAESTTAISISDTSTVPVSTASQQNDYEKLVYTLKDYLGRPPVCYEKSWRVTSSLRSGLLELPIKGINEDQNCGYCILTCALKKIALNDQIDTQVRFNAMNALVEKGDKYLKPVDEADSKMGKKFDADNSNSELFYFIVQRLNELLTHENAGNLPASIKDKANHDMVRFLAIELPSAPAPAPAPVPVPAPAETETAPM